MEVPIFHSLGYCSYGSWNGNCTIRDYIRRFSIMNSSYIDVSVPLPKRADQAIESIESIQNALQDGLYPHLIRDCTGGTYLCYGTDSSPKAVFKPLDEEPYCRNNPKSLTPRHYSHKVDRGITPGTAGYREVAAFYLDHQNFAKVPETLLVKMSGSFFEGSRGKWVSKEGSLQLFVNHECSSEDYGPSKYSLLSVQSIGVLDIRLLNLDRHENNLLVCPASGANGSDLLLHLVPIDHGYGLPALATQAIPLWCWRAWSQARQPLLPEVVRYLRQLDGEADACMLRETLPAIPEVALDTLRATTQWLQIAAQEGLCLAEIASFFQDPCCDGRTWFQHMTQLYYKQRRQSFVAFLNTTGREIMMTCVSSIRSML